MGLSVYNIKKWIKMLTGKSILHVEQGIGKIYSLNEIKGYYNDLTNKVLKDKEIDKIKIPLFNTEKAGEVFFPITIFQYGLGAFDLFLLENKDIYLRKFEICVKWALDNQKNDGSWETFHFIWPDYPYSSMAQAEGASLLLRAYTLFKDGKYLDAAEKAIDFMITPVEQGGTALYKGEEIYFLECTNSPEILNGWIFSLFGLWDMILAKPSEKLKNIFNQSINTLAVHINDFDTGYWSKYSSDNMIASPFYHKLHISLLYIIYEITGKEIFNEYYIKWINYQHRLPYRVKAFILKAVQKILEK